MTKPTKRVRKIKAWVAIEIRAGLMYSFTDIRATRFEAQKAATWNESRTGYRYRVCPVTITYSLPQGRKQKKLR